MAVTRKRKAAAPKNPSTPPRATNQTPITSTSRVSYKDDDPFYKVFDASSSSDGESDVSEYAGRKRRKTNMVKVNKHKAKKRNPGPGPEAPEISDDEYDMSEDETSTVKNSGVDSIVSVGKSPGVLSIQIPALRSPTNLNLNLSDLLAQVGVQLNLRSPSPSSRSISRDRTLIAESTAATTGGFLKLPKELRDQVYRCLFVSKEPIVFNKRDNFQHSAQFLSTCTTVASEGAAVLYGENAFHFSRTADRRGGYNDKIWKEIGFKDIRRFLSEIGSLNLSYLKYVSFTLEDAAPYLTPYLESAMRGYVNDAVLLEIFHMLGNSTVLSRFAISFCGRAKVVCRDVHFLRALAGIKCYEFYHAHNYFDRIEEKALNTLIAAMLIKKKDADNINESQDQEGPDVL